MQLDVPQAHVPLSTWLRRRAQLENDKGNLWLAMRVLRLADWLDSRRP